MMLYRQRFVKNLHLMWTLIRAHCTLIVIVELRGGGGLVRVMVNQRIL